MAINVDAVQALALAIDEVVGALDEVTTAEAEACVEAAVENLVAALGWEVNTDAEETPND